MYIPQQNGISTNSPAYNSNSHPFSNATEQRTPKASQENFALKFIYLYRVNGKEHSCVYCMYVCMYINFMNLMKYTNSRINVYKQAYYCMLRLAKLFGCRQEG